MDKYLKFIFFYFIFFAAILIIKIQVFHNTPSWDAGHHLTMSFNYFTALKESSFSHLKDLFMNSDQIYPPFYHLLIALGFLIFGIEEEIGIYANIPFIFLLIISTYKLGAQVGGKKVGLIAGTLTPILPALLHLQENVFIDYASIALFIGCYYFLFKTNHLFSVKYSIIFGIFIFLNLITKWPFVLPAIPFFFYILKSLTKKESRPEKQKQLINILIIFAFSLFGLEWYKYNYKSIIETLSFFSDPNGVPQTIWNTPKGLTVENLLYYGFYAPISNIGIGVVATFLFMISLIFKKTKSIYTKYFFASIVVTYITLTYMNDKTYKYIVYIYPLIIILTTRSIMSIKNIKIKNFLITIFCGSIVLNFLSSNINFPNQSNNFVFPGYATKFTKDPWPTEMIAQEYLNKENCKNGVLILPDHEYVNYPVINYYIQRYKGNVNVSPLYAFYNPAKDDIPEIGILKNFDCVISKNGNLGDFATPKAIEMVEKKLVTEKYSSHSFDSPDGSKVTIYIKVRMKSKKYEEK